MVNRLLRRRIFWAGAVPVLAGVLYLAFGVFGIQALFIDKRVDEEFPASRPVSGASVAARSTPTAQPTEPPAPTPPPTAVPTAAQPTSAAATPAPSATPAPIATPAPSATPAPPEGPVLIAAGQFHNVVHVGTGDALIYRQPDGSHVLRLENFDVENGPDLYVYVVAAPDSDNAETVESAGFISLGLLKGNQGNQNYQLPAEYDPAVHRSVTIWCKRFAVNFVTAPLAAIQ